MEETMSRRERKKLQSRNKILESAVSMFQSKGYQATSIADIMNTADLGIGTFYNHFTSKEEILLYMLDKITGEVEAKQVEMREAGMSHAEILPAMVMVTAKWIDENRFVLPLFLSVGMEGQKKNSEERKLHPPMFMHMFMRLIKEGQEKGEFRSDIAPELIAEIFHSLFQAAAFSKLNVPFQENINSKLSILMDGINSKNTEN